MQSACLWHSFPIVHDFSFNGRFPVSELRNGQRSLFIYFMNDGFFRQITFVKRLFIQLDTPYLECPLGVSFGKVYPSHVFRQRREYQLELGFAGFRHPELLIERNADSSADGIQLSVGIGKETSFSYFDPELRPVECFNIGYGSRIADHQFVYFDARTVPRNERRTLYYSLFGLHGAGGAQQQADNPCDFFHVYTTLWFRTKIAKFCCSLYYKD